MINLPNLNASRHTIAAFDFISDKTNLQISRLTDSSGRTYEVSSLQRDPDTGLYTVVLTGWGNCFDLLESGASLRANNGDVLTTLNFRYITKGCTSDLVPGEMVVMNHLLGPNEPNKFIV